MFYRRCACLGNTLGALERIQTHVTCKIMLEINLLFGLFLGQNNLMSALKKVCNDRLTGHLQEVHCHKIGTFIFKS